MSAAGIKVGDLYEVVRRYGTGDGKKVAHCHQDKITKVTAKRAYFANGRWFALNDPKRVVKPDYCDYVTTADEVSQ